MNIFTYIASLFEPPKDPLHRLNVNPHFEPTATTKELWMRTAKAKRDFGSISLTQFFDTAMTKISICWFVFWLAVVLEIYSVVRLSEVIYSNDKNLVISAAIILILIDLLVLEIFVNNISHKKVENLFLPVLNSKKEINAWKLLKFKNVLNEDAKRVLEKENEEYTEQIKQFKSYWLLIGLSIIGLIKIILIISSFRGGGLGIILSNNFFKNSHFSDVISCIGIYVLIPILHFKLTKHFISFRNFNAKLKKEINKYQISYNELRNSSDVPVTGIGDHPKLAYRKYEYENIEIHFNDDIKTLIQITEFSFNKNIEKIMSKMSEINNTYQATNTQSNEVLNALTKFKFKRVGVLTDSDIMTIVNLLECNKNKDAKAYLACQLREIQIESMLNQDPHNPQ